MWPKLEIGSTQKAFVNYCFVFSHVDASGNARKGSNEISESLHGDKAIKNWDAYFSAYGIKSGNDAGQ